MTQNNSNWERIYAIISWANMTTNYFARHIGLPYGENLYQIKRGNNGISRDVAERIVAKFPAISKAWILTGEGSMFASESSSASQIPFYNCDIETGLRNIDSMKPSSSLFIPQLGSCDLAMVYNGQAMGRSTPPGTVVIIKKTDIDAIILGEEYVVVCEKFVTLRKLRVAKTKTGIKLVAGDRKHFDDMTLERSEIEALYHVEGKLIINN